jgi:hypothetical protein
MWDLVLLEVIVRTYAYITVFAYFVGLALILCAMFTLFSFHFAYFRPTADLSGQQEHYWPATEPYL